MNAEDIKLFAESILGETIEDTLFYTALNAMKDRREESRPWMFLRKLDSSNSSPASNIALPADFRSDRKVVINNVQYTPISFEDQHDGLNQFGRYFVDYAGGTYTILGNQSGTIYFYYIKTTPELVEGAKPVWPDRFHKSLGFDVAGYIMNGQDADDLYARMSPENKGQAQALINAMELYDTNLQIQSQGGRVGMEGGYGGDNLEQM